MFKKRKENGFMSLSKFMHISTVVGTGKWIQLQTLDKELKKKKKKLQDGTKNNNKNTQCGKINTSAPLGEE